MSTGSLPRQNPWTEERTQRLRDLWAQGHSAREIAKIFGGGFTRNAVIGRAYRIGLVRPALTPEEKARRAARQGEGGKRKRHPRRALVFGPGPVTAPLPIDPSEVAACDAAIVPAQRQSLMTLLPHHCRWPVGDPLAEGFFFCGADAMPEKSYCADHYARAYEPLRPKAAVELPFAPSQPDRERKPEAA